MNTLLKTQYFIVFLSAFIAVLLLCPSVFKVILAAFKSLHN